MFVSKQKKPQVLWKGFCARMKLAADSVPLFDVDEDLRVGVHEIGTRIPRFLLKRSSEMEEMVIEAASQLAHDWRGDGDFDGLILHNVSQGCRWGSYSALCRKN